MAQLIEIPMSFEFRSTRVRWEETVAKVMGWWKPKGGTSDPAQLIAEIASEDKKRRIAIHLSSLPAKERERCLATLRKPHSDETVKEICSELELRYFVHDHKTYIEDTELRKHSRPADAWQLRDDFMRLKHDGPAVDMLNKWGRWMPHRNYVDLAEIMSLQRAVRQGLTSPAKIWLQSPYAHVPVAKSRSSDFPYFVALTDSCKDAIRAATTIDLLRDLRFKTCARTDCGMPFQVTSKHERNYCTQYCAHLESVRRARKSTTQRSG
jgi:hypothetical protein